MLVTPCPSDRPFGPRLFGIALVALLHVAIGYALVNGLARRAVDQARVLVEATIIDPTPPQKLAPPPPPPEIAPPPKAVPPPKIVPRPPLFVPPPEVKVQHPLAPPKQSTAPMVITTERSPAADPVRILPRIDPQHSREPEYPAQSRRLGEQGSLVLQALIDIDGRVLETKLLQSSGFDRLDQAALDGIKSNYRFAPGTIDGKPQAMWYTFKFTWKLR
jgi:periplasmic protein TonB